LIDITGLVLLDKVSGLSFVDEKYMIGGENPTKDQWNSWMHINLDKTDKYFDPIT